MALGTTRAKMVSGERLIVLFQARFLQAVGFTSVCSTWCRGRGQSGAVISWYAAVRNEARARRRMLRGDDFWQFELLPGISYQYQALQSSRALLCIPIKLLFTVFFHGEISVQIFLMRILRTSGRNGGVVAKNKTVKSNFIGF